MRERHDASAWSHTSAIIACVLLVCALGADSQNLPKETRQLLQGPSLGQKGGICGGFASIQCDAGLVCGGVDPNQFDAAGTCRDPPQIGKEGGLCGGIGGFPCNTGLTCQGVATYPDASGTCVKTSSPVPGACKSCSCTKKKAPVCDVVTQKTYTNTCKAKCCGAKRVVKGACSKPVQDRLRDPNCICFALYDPVCGTDGKTYSNSCEAGCSKVPVASKGKCSTKNPCSCPLMYVPQPVCARNLVTGKNSTYSSPCEADCQSAFILYRGACANSGLPEIQCKCKPGKKNKSDAVCATDPVTGITSTYGNYCLAGCARFPIVYQGPCWSPGSVKGKTCDCSQYSAPVCATTKRRRRRSRKVTFENLCTASCSGATKYTPGKCRSSRRRLRM